MPLLDHFRPPLSTQRHWESFHTTWASAIADALNERWLPEGYFAEEQMHPAARVEVDVATFESSGGGAISTVAPKKTWTPPAPSITLPRMIFEGTEVLVFDREGGPTLVAAIELVSPVNKDRAETRRTFVAKCASLLASGVGLVIIDVVTSRMANLHRELLEMQGHAHQTDVEQASLYAVSYQPVRRGERDELDLWPMELAVGRPLPQVPLGIGPDFFVPVDLESTYMAACRRRRLA
ncbi:MAG: DUF4058 family protein [Pirellulaceae bacterium]